MHVGAFGIDQTGDHVTGVLPEMFDAVEIPLWNDQFSPHHRMPLHRRVSLWYASDEWNKMGDVVPNGTIPSSVHPHRGRHKQRRDAVELVAHDDTPVCKHVFPPSERTIF
jgi:hypothetical protein